MSCVQAASLGLSHRVEFIEELCSAAQREESVRQRLSAVRLAWDPQDSDIGALTPAFVCTPPPSCGFSFATRVHKTRTMAFVPTAMEFALGEDAIVLASLKTLVATIPFSVELAALERMLVNVNETVDALAMVHHAWASLEGIFLAGADVRSALPSQAIAFDHADAAYRDAIHVVHASRDAVALSQNPSFVTDLTMIRRELEAVTASLELWLDAKRAAFPRFFFLSSDDLLLVVGTPLLVGGAASVGQHMTALFPGVSALALKRTPLVTTRVSQQAVGSAPVALVAPTLEASGMTSKEGELVIFERLVPLDCTAAQGFSSIEAAMRNSLARALAQCFVVAAALSQLEPTTQPLRRVGDGAVDTQTLTTQRAREDDSSLGRRSAWVRDFPGQTLLASSALAFTAAVEKALHSADPRSALKALRRRQAGALAEIVDMARCGVIGRAVLLPASTIAVRCRGSAVSAIAQTMLLDYGGDAEACARLNRLKITALITAELHARDVVEQLCAARVVSARDFLWDRQLRFEYTKSDAAVDVHVISPVAVANQDKITATYGIATAQQAGCHLDCGHEYGGLAPRLVITPLTDRAILALTSSLHACCVGAPTGPAGVGKSETVHELARAIGKLLIVINCSESLDHRSLGRILCGLAAAGCWGCFDEVNRLTVEVMSVMVAQVSTILDAARSCSRTVTFLGSVLSTPGGIGIFVTLNPTPARGFHGTQNDGGGRSEVPDSMQALFRPIAMCVPDVSMIAEVMMIANGFGPSARVLARKAATLWTMCRTRLSKQQHYDFSLRDLRPVLMRVGQLQAASAMSHLQSVNNEANMTSQRDSYVFVRAVCASVLPRLVTSDVATFLALIRDLWPETPSVTSYTSGTAPSALHSSSDACKSNIIIDIHEDDAMMRLRNEVVATATSSGLQVTTALIHTATALWDSMVLRPCVMLVGATLTGKTTAWRTLATAQNVLSRERQCRVASGGVIGAAVHVQVINPKALTLEELYGEYEGSSGCCIWRDGVLSSVLRRFVGEVTPEVAVCARRCEDLLAEGQSQSNEVVSCDELTSHRWIVLDGSIDPVWAESVNSLMDDNRTLTLANGDRISVPIGVSLLFETDNLASASPSTISRVGVVYVDSQSVTWETVLESWIEVHGGELTRATILRQTGGGQWPATEIAIAIADTTQQLRAYIYKYLHELLMICHEIGDVRNAPCAFFRTSNSRAPAIQAIALFCELLASLLETAQATTADFSSSAHGELTPADLWIACAATWSIGGFAASSADRRKFSDTLLRIQPSLFPAHCCAWDYFPAREALSTNGKVTDQTATRMRPWADGLTASWRPSIAAFPGTVLVPTCDTLRVRYILRALLAQRSSVKPLLRPILVVGAAAVGKTAIVSCEIADCLGVATECITLTSRMRSASIRRTVEQALVRRSKCKFGLPPGKSRLLLFVDDAGVPSIDAFGSQPPLELLRQLIGHGGWWSTGRPEWHTIADVQIIAAAQISEESRSEQDTDGFAHDTRHVNVGPACGLPQRLVSHFSVVTVRTAADDGLNRILGAPLRAGGTGGWLAAGSSDEVRRIGVELVSITKAFMGRVRTAFPVTSSRPYYNFTLRDAVRLVIGMTRADVRDLKSRSAVLQLWRNEAHRNFGDRLSTQAEHTLFESVVCEAQAAHASLLQLHDGPVLALPNTDRGLSFSCIVPAGERPVRTRYGTTPITALQQDRGAARRVIEPALMDTMTGFTNSTAIVACDFVARHIIRVSHALSMHRGHAVLVGAGGSGRRTIARCAALLTRPPQQQASVISGRELVSRRTVPDRCTTFVVLESFVDTYSM